MKTRFFLIFALLAFTLPSHTGYASWEILQLPTDRGFTAIWAINEHTIFVTGHEGLWKTFDGSVWEIDSGYQTNSIYFADDTLGFLRGSILTIDGGKTWLKGDTINGNVGRINFPKGQSLIGYGLGYDYVSKTTDGGWHWSQLPPLPDVYPGFDEIISPDDICFPKDPDTGYLTVTCIKQLSDGEIEYHNSYFETLDGGQSWVLNEEGLWNDDFNPRYIDFPVNSSVGYMSGGYEKGTTWFGCLYKTTDGGATWDTVLKTPDDYPNIYDICFPETDQVGYVLNDTMIHKTTDGGKTWQTFGLGQDTVFLRCHFLNDSVGFISGTGTTAYNSLNPYTPGFVMKTTDGLLGIAEEPVAKPARNWQVISSIGREVVLQYSDLPHGFHASVFDAVGRKIEELHSTKNSGQIVWGEGYSSGVYFIRARGTENNHTARVVIVR